MPRGSIEDMRAALAALQDEAREVRASRARLVRSFEADLVRIERALHDGVQQHLVGAAVGVQVVEEALAAGDGPAIRAVLADLAQALQDAIDAAADLAQRIHPPLLDARGLGAALRSAATRSAAAAQVDVVVDPVCPPDVARAVYVCVADVLEDAAAESRVAITVRGEPDGLGFLIAADENGIDAALERLRDRVDVLGGALSVRSEPAGRVAIAGSIPFGR